MRPPICWGFLCPFDFFFIDALLCLRHFYFFLITTEQRRGRHFFVFLSCLLPSFLLLLEVEVEVEVVAAAAAVPSLDENDLT